MPLPNFDHNTGGLKPRTACPGWALRRNPLAPASLFHWRQDLRITEGDSLTPSKVIRLSPRWGIVNSPCIRRSFNGAIGTAVRHGFGPLTREFTR